MSFVCTNELVPAASCPSRSQVNFVDDCAVFEEVVEGGHRSEGLVRKSLCNLMQDNSCRAELGVSPNSPSAENDLRRGS